MLYSEIRSLGFRVLVWSSESERSLGESVFRAWRSDAWELPRRRDEDDDDSLPREM